MLLGSIILFLLAAILFFVGFFVPPSLATAQVQQQEQQQTTTTTTATTPPSSSLSITSITIPPLTPEEQREQNRLQSTIAATTRDLNETEKQVSGVVFTPRWSEPVWINANSIAVLIAYCLPGEFADSGQEILGGFGLEVLESYAVDLPQGFMAWMAVVGNEDGNVRLPAALGVICASDLNQADTRVLSPQEQQQINNINQQFTTIQNTQITNIDQVINIINDVTTNGTTTTGPVTPPPPPSNQTGGNNTGGGGGLPKQELIVQIIPNATRGFVGASFQLKADIVNGTSPYSYEWGPLQEAQASHPCSDQFGKPSYSCIVYTPNQGGTHKLSLTVKDSQGKTGSDSILISVRRLPLGGGGVLDNATVAGEGFRAEIIANATQAYTGATIKFDASITGGVPPYSYTWSVPNVGAIDQDRSITQMFFEPGTITYILTARDSMGQTASDTVQIVIRERLPRGGLLGEGLLDNATVQGEGLGGETSSREEGGGITTEEPTEEEELGGVAPPTAPEEDTGGTPPETGEEPSPPPPPPSDDTGEEGGGTPPSTTTTEEQEPPL
jgi:hypothetical protein